MMKTKSRKFYKNGFVSAPDSRWTGEEPTWEGVESWEPDKIKSNFSRALNFYNYYLDTEDYIPIIVDYIKSSDDLPNKKETISMINKSPKCIEIVSCGKLARMINMGMPKMIGDTQYGNVVVEYLKKISKRVPVEKVAKKKIERKVSVFDIMQEKIRKEVLVRLDEMLDEWVTTPTTKVNKINVQSLLKGVNAPISSLGSVREWLEKQKDELVQARDKTCPDSVEGYSYLSKPAIKKRITLLDEILTDVDLYKSSKQSQRKPRVKKSKSADKLVAKLKYLKSSPDYGVSSINPVKIIGSNKVYMFNEKYRVLTVLVSSGGLTVSGTTIKDFDPENSYSMKLRKPNDVLPFIVTKTDRQITNMINKLTTNKTEAKGRVNENTIILKS